MRKSILLLCATLFSSALAFANPGDIAVSQETSAGTTSVELTYTPLAKQQWMSSQNVYIYSCVELDKNGEWVHEKAEWSLCNKANFKWTKKNDGTLSYTISDVQSYYGLTNEEMNHLTGIFVILKNDKFQTSDKYIAIRSDNSVAEAFTGTVLFKVQVPKGTETVYVAGTFQEEGQPLYWKHAEKTMELKKVDETHFAGVLNNVPADLHYLYVWGPRKDQAEARWGHRPLGARSEVNDIVDYWGDMTLNVVVPRNTKEVYVSGSFNNGGFSRMFDVGNNTWTYHIAPTSLGGNEKLTYKYYYKNSKDAVEAGNKYRILIFQGFATQYDEVKSWK